MVRYVDQQNLVIDKYEYLRPCAQLSTHERAALLVNSITRMGQDWWLKHLIVKYRIVQNIPLGFFDGAKEFDPTKLFERSGKLRPRLMQSSGSPFSGITPAKRYDSIRSDSAVPIPPLLGTCAPNHSR